ncbi:hypothetical protein KIN20_000702 [Parelaphostrongylus tenuis]|uniref:Uncharacterized protein n=1 Tax=Parelaphostrongylus tenuis TaxID=148309 RepID=A0AAD5ME24_PARTN|nr:hypothetical protein KIN20_000702 [Parelaphostrongylus tenuis]
MPSCSCSIQHPILTRFSVNILILVDFASTRAFTASGPSNLPVIAVYTENSAVSAIVPGIATSKGAVQALAQRFAMQTVVDVLEIEGRRALLPDFVISNILGQLQVSTTYEPLQCQIFRKPGE